MPELRVNFDSIDRKTQNKVRFSEAGSDGKSGAIDKLYLRKTEWDKLGNPEAVEVIIRPKAPPP